MPGKAGKCVGRFRLVGEIAELQNSNGSLQEILRLFYAPFMHRVFSICGGAIIESAFWLLEGSNSVPF